MLFLLPYVAAMRRPDVRAHADSQEVRLRTPVPGDDWPRTFVLPGPRALVVGVAGALADSGVEAFRDPTGCPVARDPDGRMTALDLGELRRDVLAALATLEGSHHYAEALRDLAELAPGEAEEYVDRALALLGRRHVLRDLPADRSARPAALTTSERKKRSRAQIATWEAETVEAFVAWYLTNDEAPAPGTRVPVKEAKDTATFWIEDAVQMFDDVRSDLAAYEDDLWAWRRREEARRRAHRGDAFRIPAPLPKPDEPDSWIDVMTEEDYPEHPRLPGRTRLGTLLTDHLGAPQHRRDGDFYTIPAPESKENPMNAPELRDLAEAARQATAEVRALTAAERELHEQREALSHGDRLGALQAQRRRFSAPPAAQGVLDAGSRFAGRASGQ